MNRKSPANRKTATRRAVKTSAKRVRRSTPDELSRLSAASAEPIDTSDIPERVGKVSRVRRDQQGGIIRTGGSPLRSAILNEMRRREISGHRLWKEARTYCPTLPESAVYEFLNGKRQIGLAYLDAIMQAMNLVLVPA